MARPTLYEHRKFHRLVSQLKQIVTGDGVSVEAMALGHLGFLWRVAYDAGDPIIGDALDVETAARWKGPAGELARALLDAGGPGRPGLVDVCELMPGDEAVYEIHDFWDHAPEYVKRRRLRELQRKERSAALQGDRSVTDQTPVSDRPVTSQRPTSGRSVVGTPKGYKKKTPPTPPARSVSDQSVTGQPKPPRVESSKWESVRAKLKADLDPDTFGTWIAPLYPTDGENLTVVAPTQRFRTDLISNLLDTINNAAGEPVRITHA